jgi:hypothetical protein
MGILINLLFIFVFIVGAMHLLQYRFNLMKAVHISKDALYPKNKDEFSSILLPPQWKEMQPITFKTRSYQYVKWGTNIALMLLIFLLLGVLFTDWLRSSYLSVAYLFFVIINAIKHQGNLFILENGIIINGKYYSTNKIKNYDIEQIIRWHHLYGLHSRVNYAYKLTFNLKNKLFGSNYIVVEDQVHLDQIMVLLDQQGITGFKTNEC